MRVSPPLCLILALLLAAVAPEASEDDVAQERVGPYVGLDFGVGFTTFNEDLSPIAGPAGAGKVDVDDSLALNVRVGYRLTPLIAAEVQYEWF